MLRSAGARAGLAIRPATSIEPYADLLPEIDTVLVMTVEPGFGGQAFLDVMLPKIRRARQLVRDGEHAVWVQVDGGVDADTIERCAEAGADVFVAGSAVYGRDDPAEAVRRLRDAAKRAAAGAWWAAG
jgi:ribulose-phosphate 3-epimerase